MSEVNSAGYWRERFSTDWLELGGDKQTHFFSQLALAASPRWVLQWIVEERMFICDFGCALGQGVDDLSAALPGCRVLGVDIADSAVEQAAMMFPDLEFAVADLLTEPRSFDCVFSSNTLEHFEDAHGAMDRLSLSSKTLMWFLVPFRDRSGLDEHFFDFDRNSIPLSAGSHRLAYAMDVRTSRLPGTEWRGRQVLLVYVHDEQIDEARRRTRDLELEMMLLATPAAGSLGNLSTRFRVAQWRRRRQLRLRNSMMQRI